MADNTLGFRLYKCLHGWCFVRDDVSVVFEPTARIRAYSSLSQALWHLDKRAKEIENAERARRDGIAEARKVGEGQALQEPPVPAQPAARPRKEQQPSPATVDD